MIRRDDVSAGVGQMENRWGGRSGADRDGGGVREVRLGDAERAVLDGGVAGVSVGLGERQRAGTELGELAVVAGFILQHDLDAYVMAVGVKDGSVGGAQVDSVGMVPADGRDEIRVVPVATIRVPSKCMDAPAWFHEMDGPEIDGVCKVPPEKV